MLDDNSATLRGVVWTEILPWLRIFHTFRIAVSVRALAAAAAGLVLMLVGWALIGQAFGVPGASFQNYLSAISRASAAPVDGPLAPALMSGQGARVAWSVMDNPGPIAVTWSFLTAPLFAVFHPVTAASDVFSSALSGLWALAVWSLFGAAIARMATVQLAAEERVGLASALRFAVSKWTSMFAAPLLPIAGVLLCAIPVALLGLIINSDLGAALAALIWPLALAAGVVMALLMLGLIFGWPLMPSTICTEGSDAFDAISRSYAYVFQRPLHYLFYAVVAGLLGLLGWLLVSGFAEGVLVLTAWATDWGLTSERLPMLLGGTTDPAAEAGDVALFAAAVFGFWTACVRLIAISFLFSFFWSAAPCFYLLLRRDVDATEMDEVYLDEDASEPVHGLPSVEQDQSGAPRVVEPGDAATENAGAVGQAPGSAPTPSVSDEASGSASEQQPTGGEEPSPGGEGVDNRPGDAPSEGDDRREQP